MSEKVSHLWRLVEDWRKSQRFDVTQAALARDIGVARSAVSQWKSGAATPTPENMRAIQSATGIRYRDLLDALLQDLGYLPPTKKEGDDGGDTAPTRKGARGKAARPQRKPAAAPDHRSVTFLPKR